MAAALHTLSTHGETPWLHADIKPLNIFLVNVDGEYPRALLANIDLAVELVGPDNYMPKRIGGTDGYYSPVSDQSLISFTALTAWNRSVGTHSGKTIQ